MNVYLKAIYRTSITTSLGLFLCTPNSYSATTNVTLGNPNYTWKADFNDDGKMDIASADSGKIYMNLSVGDNFESTTWLVADNWGGSNYTWVGDFNGDGKADIASANAGNVHMKLSTGNSFTSENWGVSNNWGTSDYTWVADFNGDGKSDIASAYGGKVYMKLSNGSGFDQETWTVPNNWGSASYTWVGDFDGDGKSDIASAHLGNIQMRLSTGKGFYNKTWTVPNAWGGPDYTWVGDFNDDGKDDIASANGGNVYMHLSEGNGFDNQTWSVPNKWGGSNYTWVDDFNGDGKSDIASANAGEIYIHSASSGQFSSLTLRVSNTWGSSSFTWSGDFNGDGKADIASATTDEFMMTLSTASSQYLSQQWVPTPLSTKKFSMIVMSDPQFNWSCQESQNTTNDYCKSETNRAKSEQVQANETNQNHVDAIKKIQNTVTSTNNSHFAGVIINGDLTEFGSQDNNLSKFRNYYANQPFNMWPGLGNHDYSNNVNDCGAPGWANYNYCGAEMVQYLADFAKHSPTVSSHDVTKFSKNFLQAGSQRNVSGSLAYSWDVGDFHFVQLNNHPLYEVYFTRGYTSGISSWDINVNLPTAWLNNDLSSLRPTQKVILNWHIYQTGPSERAELINLLAPYADSIKAIFVGHNHSNYGKLDRLRFPAVAQTIPSTDTQPKIAVRPAIDIPVIYFGAAIYNRFIQADFDTRNGDCSIVTQVINTIGGNAIPANSSNGSSGRHTIDCN